MNTGVPNVHAHGAGTAEPNANATVATGSVESPVRGDAHAGFGDAGRGNGLGRKTSTAPRLDSTMTGLAAPVSAARRTSKPRRWPRCTGCRSSQR